MKRNYRGRPLLPNYMQATAECTEGTSCCLSPSSLPRVVPACLPSRGSLLLCHAILHENTHHGHGHTKQHGTNQCDQREKILHRDIKSNNLPSTTGFGKLKLSRISFCLTCTALFSYPCLVWSLNLLALSLLTTCTAFARFS